MEGEGKGGEGRVGEGREGMEGKGWERNTLNTLSMDYHESGTDYQHGVKVRRGGGIDTTTR
jgi:hypothetical protein